MYGVQSSFVSRELAAPIEMYGRFFSLATFAPASAVDELVPPMILVVREHQLDLLAGELLLHIGDREADRFNAALSVDVRVQRRHVGDEADDDLVARQLLRLGAAHAERQPAHRQRGANLLQFHSVSSSKGSIG